ncbi:hypothetical protein BTE54_06960 [Agrobacterium sp. YIC 4121]|nr:hypothetical protein BTE54_06960 [Agrobacterium sp. YIC 4121]
MRAAVLGSDGGCGFTPSVLPDISPSRGEIDSRLRYRLSQKLKMKCCQRLLPISPLEGEMPGRAEGGSPSL